MNGKNITERWTPKAEVIELPKVRTALKVAFCSSRIDREQTVIKSVSIMLIKCFDYI